MLLIMTAMVNSPSEFFLSNSAQERRIALLQALK
jgi:hypothetical protein